MDSTDIGEYTTAPGVIPLPEEWRHLLHSYKASRSPLHVRQNSTFKITAIISMCGRWFQQQTHHAPYSPLPSHWTDPQDCIFPLWAKSAAIKHWQPSWLTAARVQDFSTFRLRGSTLLNVLAKGAILNTKATYTVHKYFTSYHLIMQEVQVTSNEVFGPHSHH